MSEQGFRETDLYPSISAYWMDQGFTVHAEVCGCDIVAVKGERIVVVELKRRVETTLLLQATQRQRFADAVYVGLPHPGRMERSRRWRHTLHLLRRLELGLMLVRLKGRKSQSPAEIPFHPGPIRRPRSHRTRSRLIAEVKGRSANQNVGGSVGTPLMTAYKENCIHIAACLATCGPLSPAALRELGTGPQTQSILSKNHYGWFLHLGRALWGLSAIGETELLHHPDLVAHHAPVTPESTR